MASNNLDMTNKYAQVTALVEEMRIKATSLGVSLPPDLLDVSVWMAAQKQELNGQDISSHNLQPGLLAGSSLHGCEHVPSNIPIEMFRYGADWDSWVVQFESAVKAATNCSDKDRLEELYLMWIAIKLSPEAIPVYDSCSHKDKDWTLLKAELSEAFENPRIKHKWARQMDAYKKAPNIPLQVYKDNVVGLVNKLSHMEDDWAAYEEELFSRFVGGLDEDWREYIEDTLPFGIETLENAYHQALKFEAKLEKKALPGAAMSRESSDANEDKLDKISSDLKGLHL